ncbi:MAG: DUF4974 domain-containing protein [Agriterribacter sp.]
MHTYQNFGELFHKYIHNQCSPSEVEQLLHWLESESLSPEDKKLVNDFLQSQPAPESPPSLHLQQLLDKNAQQILKRIDENAVPMRQGKRFPWLRLTAAVIMIAAIGVSYIWLKNQKNQPKTLAIKEETPAKKNISPGSNKAVLTLDNGKQIVLDDAENGELTQQGNTKIIKIGDKLEYEKQSEKDRVVYNTIATPRGGQYQLELADGSKVWLNAASSLRFPTSFPNKDRTVELTGEGYFEIAKNANQPFYVKVKGTEVKVLGTHFNIMAYDDEATLRTTLLEGSVAIKNGKNSAFLKPGEQARIQNESLKIKDDVDIEEVVAWKNGYFQFDRNANVQQIMRQISRWYDVDITYESDLPKRSFGGKISRDSDLKEVLQVLELSKIHFNIEGRKIVVKP